MGSSKTETAKMPQFQEDFLKETVIPFAEDFLATPYESYTGERVAGMTPLQQQAMTGYGALSMGDPLYGQAAGAYGQLSEMEAPTMQAAQIGDVGTIAGADMSQYMSPYTEAVIESGQADIERQRQLASQRMGAEAERAGAFGGSRQAVQEGVLAGEAARQAAQLSAQQRQAGFQHAQRAAQFDITGQQQRALQQAQLQQQAGISGQQAALDAARLRGAGAAGLGSIAGQQLQSQLAGLGAQTAAGEAQRAISQAQLDVPYQDYLAAMQYPLTQFGVLTGAAGAVPQGYGTTTTKEGGLGYTLSALGSAGQGLGAMGFMPFSDVALKKNIKKVGQINDINLYRWDWNEEAKSIGADQYPSTGVIAQEVEKKYPEHVIIDGTGYRRVNYTGLYSDLGAV